MQTENKNSVVRVLCTLLIFAHISMGTLQTCGDQGSSLCSIFNLRKIDEKGERLFRHKRSALTDAGYGSRLQAGSNIATSSNVLRRIYGKFGPGKRSIHLPEKMDEDRSEGLQTFHRILSDDGCCSKLQTDENIAYSNDPDIHFGVTRPWKRSVEDFDMIYGDNAMKNKRLSTDYGYGSRLQDGRNVAKALDGNRLFGTMGPGKRSYSKQQDITKRIVSDLGYGSRWQAAENAAKSSSNEDLFGAYGPGKRNS